jgi:hypothetical protein
VASIDAFNQCNTCEGIVLSILVMEVLIFFGGGVNWCWDVDFIPMYVVFLCGKKAPLGGGLLGFGLSSRNFLVYGFLLPSPSLLCFDISIFIPEVSDFIVTLDDGLCSINYDFTFGFAKSYFKFV